MFDYFVYLSDYDVFVWRTPISVHIGFDFANVSQPSLSEGRRITDHSSWCKVRKRKKNDKSTHTHTNANIKQASGSRTINKHRASPRNRKTRSNIHGAIQYHIITPGTTHTHTRMHTRTVWAAYFLAAVWKCVVYVYICWHLCAFLVAVVVGWLVAVLLSMFGVW